MMVLKDKRSDLPNNFEHAKLQILLDENSAWMIEESAEALNVSYLIVSHHFSSFLTHIMGKIQKEIGFTYKLSELAIRIIICIISDKCF